MNINGFIVSIDTGVDSPALDGNTPNRSFSPSADSVSTMYASSANAANAVQFCGIAPLKIKRARLTNANLEIEGNGARAAKVVIAFCKIVEGAVSGDPFATVTLNFSKWNKWEDKDIVVDFASSADTAANRPCSPVIKTTSTFGVYDYNIQGDMVGQTVRPVIDMEVECGNLIDATTGLAI